MATALAEVSARRRDRVPLIYRQMVPPARAQHLRGISGDQAPGLRLG
jgi:hypothetical protein